MKQSILIALSVIAETIIRLVNGIGTRVLCAFLTFFLTLISSLSAQNCNVLDQTELWMDVFEHPRKGLTLSVNPSKQITNYESEVLLTKIKGGLPYNGELSIDIGDGVWIPVVNNGLIELKFNTPFPIEREIKVQFTYSTGGRLTESFKMKYKRLTTNNKKKYKDPDEILTLQTKGPFTPPATGYYHPDSTYGKTTYGYAKAYIKVADPTNQLDINGKIKFLCNPIVFVEGLDLSLTKYCDRDGNSIRYGAFGWDVFWLGQSDGPEGEGFDYLA
ncbi:MAG: hypothetical protein HOP11_15345 [Saprospiraceae bacterium]|nr:hypothetical protein [Saprospiraceae bacterium]